ncbi:MAG: DUF4384 domain-containing protein [Bryobacteraceae bacterium]
MRCCPVALGAGIAVGLMAQQAPGPAGVRELFYAGAAPREALPPIRKAAAAERGRREARAPRPPATAPKAAPREESVVLPVAGAAARNLGLRYNLVLVDQATGRSETVTSTRNFTKGECFAIDIEANRSGYLYVLVRQSGGDWMPLLPSPRMAGESNVINPGQKVRVPSRHCFEIADPPGTEKLFVALVRDPREVTDLHDGIGTQTPEEPAPSAKPGPVLLANAHLVNDAVARMSSPVINRDILIREVGQPADSREVANSVYVVNASQEPVSKVVAEILVRHQ